MVDTSTPPRRMPPPTSSTPLLLSPALDPSSGTQQGTVADLSQVARAVSKSKSPPCRLGSLGSRPVNVRYPK
eukprot:344506-Alexandrium_andersonii.AAC.1